VAAVPGHSPENRVTMLERLARLCALLAGALIAFMVILTCGSIIGRETVGHTITGDFELVALATGAAVGLFMPLCQLHRGNIVVDFFTAKAPKRVNRVLDRIGAFLLAACCALLAWRAALGGPGAFVPADAAEVRVQLNTLSAYRATYRAARPLFEWRLATIQRLTDAGWARGRLPDSTRFDRSLWFVRRRELGFVSILEQVSIQAGDGDQPLVILTYRRSLSAPALARWLDSIR